MSETFEMGLLVRVKCTTAPIYHPSVKIPTEAITDSLHENDNGEPIHYHTMGIIFDCFIVLVTRFE